ncbi:MAG: alanine dehydrogenase [bacterium]|nr:alanine dehydrogenase [bacterium]
MIIGIPKEIKDNEYRVAITPAGVQALVNKKCKVIIEKNAGVGSGFSDEEYLKEGATIVKTSEKLYNESELILKVKKPLPKEYEMLKEGQVVFAFFHFASSKELTMDLLEKKITCIAYETVQTKEHFLPLLAPMSEIAGRMSVLEGARCLKNINGGKGILISGLPGIAPAKVIIIGGGIAGFNATMVASNLGALVTVMDINIDKLREISKVVPKNVITVIANNYEIEKRIKDADLVITAVLNRGQRAPILITKEMLKNMQPGSVVVDISIDQGGCLETSKPTTHAKPTFIKENIVHYCVTNIPGIVGRTATYALTNVTLPFVIEMARKGVKKALRENRDLAEGLNMIDGKITLKTVADYYGILPHSKKTLLS